MTTEPETLKEASIFWMARLDEEECPHHHRSLKNALASMMWNHKGNGVDLD
jgi:hypothetical protein